VLSLKGATDDEQFKKLRKQFKEEYSGSKNSGKTLLLGGIEKMDYQKLGMELGEVALKELKDMNRDDIMILWRASKTILGITDDVNRANALEMKAVFYENIVKPQCDRFVDHVNAFLMPEWGDGYVLGYKDPSFVSDTDRINEWTQGVDKWITRNEIRDQRKLNPIKGGDSLYIPIQMVPVGSDENGPTQNALKKLKKKGIKREARAEIFKELLFNNQVVWERKYLKGLKVEFGNQLKEILDNHPIKSKDIKVKDISSWLFDVDASQRRILGTFIPMGLQLMIDAAKYAFNIADDPDNQLDITEKLRQLIADRVSKFASNTNDETIKLLESSLADGIQAGESVNKMRDRVKAIYSYASDVRAERIARTETLSASNAGANEAYKQSPMVDAKEFSAEADACEICQSLNGKIIGLDDSFAKNGETLTGEAGDELKVSYGDIDYPPVHPNCRCAILPVALK
jgi:SPP1 gp7 family putative phage head morphogenesis protein